MRIGFLALFSFLNILASAQSVQIYDLSCEYLVNPLGIDSESPRFRWRINLVSQTAKAVSWQLMLSKDSAALAEGRSVLWGTTMRTDAAQSAVYDGPALEPFTRYFWRVHIIDESGLSCLSPVNWFETGFMQRAPWHGQWISDANNIHVKAAPLFRKSFTIEKPVKQARAYIAAAGLYELSFNGERVGNSVLDPAYTRFDRRILYVAHDITHLLSKGENVTGVLLGNGWYNHQSTAVWNFHEAPWRNRPAFCMDIRITYADGTTEVIGSDRDWKSTTGPIIFNSIYTAEHYDARLEIENWNKPGYSDTAWKGTIYRSAPAPQIVAQVMHPVRETDVLQPAKINRINDREVVIHFDKNIAGVVRLRIKGKSGNVVRLKHGERLYDNGRVDISNLDVHYRPQDNTDPFQTDIVILSGKGEDYFQPKFNYKGFQYVELTSADPIQDDDFKIEAVELHSDVPAVGTLYSSNDLLNKIWRATNNSYLSNLFGYPTDCPQREKNGWTGDGHIAQETGLYNFDGITVYEKWLADHRDEQQPNGVLPSIVPTGGWGYEWGNGPDWTSTIAIIPWNLYLFYGDGKPLRENYNAIKLYVDNINNRYPTGLTTWGLGDWIPVRSQTPVEFTSTAYYYKDVTILANIASVLGKREDEKTYRALAEKIKSAFNQKYFDPKKNIYGSGFQTELSVALHFDLVPDKFREKVAEQLAKRVKADGTKLDVGLLGTKSILNALSENGYGQLAYQLATRDSFPSWGWWIKNGATSLYENWPIDAKSDLSMNHIMFGEIGAWFYKALGGLNPDAESPGFKHFFLRPYFAEGLDSFGISYKSPYGQIESRWERAGTNIVYNTVIPPNSKATLQIEIPRGKTLYVNGQIKRGLKGISQLQLTQGVYTIEMK